MKHNPSELEERIREILSSAGLVFDDLDWSGEMAYCGTTQKPQGKDGRYVVHLDFPPNVSFTNYHDGGEWQKVGLWEKSDLEAMPAAEREALQERIRQEKEKRKQETERKRQEVAREAKRLFSRLPLAGEKNPYLSHKSAFAVGDVRRCDASASPFSRVFDGELLVLPVRDAGGEIVSLQFIGKTREGGFSKLFQPGGKSAGCYCPIPAKDEGKDGPLLVCEGYATGASLHMATGHAVLVAFSAGNLEAVASMARGRYPEREIILCADNDCETKGNPGKEAATRAARAVGGKLALCPAHEGKATDFNDLHQYRSLEAVRQVVEKARRAEDCIMPEGYILVSEDEPGRQAGLYKLETKDTGDIKSIRLGPPLLVKGMTRGKKGDDWGLLLEWKDPDGKEHHWAMPLHMLSRQGWDWFGVLVSGGWLGNPSTRGKLAFFLSEVRSSVRVRCVPGTGWHSSAYVLPDEVFGETGGEKIVLQSLNHAGYSTSGTLEGWQEIAALAVGNSLLSFALCGAFAGPLLRLAGLEGGGFSFEGGSSSGKTTALQVAASVWGGPEHVRSWRATDNGLEGVAALHNDNVLILDEIGQVNGRVLAESVYMLANGQGKGRSGRDGDLRRSHSWRLLFLSSGELGLAEKLAETGLKSRAGQDVRLVGLPVEKSMLTELHGLPDAGAVVNRIKSLASQHYGHAGRAFLKECTKPEILAALRDSLPAGLHNLAESMVPTGADGQVQRVAMRFALCVLAGDTAKDAGILPQDFDALGCVNTCFQNWLTARGGTGASEDRAILADVRLFFEQHGASRFQDMKTPDSICVNRVGFRRKVGDETEYIILPESFRAEVVKGHSERRAARVLADAGWLRLERAGRFKSRRTFPDIGRQDCYVLTFLADEGKEMF